MPIFKAPENVTAVETAFGERRADKRGQISIEDGAPRAEIEAIRAAGWTEIAPEAPAAEAGEQPEAEAAAGRPKRG